MQIALRVHDDDVHAWTRLGEAYASAGRHAAALKTFTRAKELAPDDWMIDLALGNVHCELGDFDTAIACFSGLADRQPNEAGIRHVLGQTHLQAGRAYRATGFVGRSESSFVAAIENAVVLIKTFEGFKRVAWKLAADASFELSRNHSLSTSGEVLTALSLLCDLLASPDPRLDGIVADLTPASGPLVVALAAYSYRIPLMPNDNHIALGAAWYDLAVSFFTLVPSLAPGDTTNRCQAAALDAIKQALRSDSSNDLFWNAFGAMHFVRDADLAQHAYIKAIELNSKVRYLTC